VEQDTKIILVSSLGVVLVTGIIFFMKYKRNSVNSSALNHQVCAAEVRICKYKHGLDMNSQPLNIQKINPKQLETAQYSKKMQFVTPQIFN